MREKGKSKGENLFEKQTHKIEKKNLSEVMIDSDEDTAFVVLGPPVMYHPNYYQVKSVISEFLR